MLLLASMLIISGILMLWTVNANFLTGKRKNPMYNGFIGGGVGMLSGIVGIGGGIFLAPILYIQKWDRPKVIAGTTAVFILANSIAALLGILLNMKVSIDIDLLFHTGLAVALGSIIGSQLSLSKYNEKMVKTFTAILIIFVGIRILSIS